MREIERPSSFARFVRMKWVIFALLILLFAYFSSLLAGGFAHLDIAKWVPLVLIGAGEALIILFLWYRLGRAAWYLLGAWFVLQSLARAIQGN